MSLDNIIKNLDLKKDNLNLLSKNFKTIKVTDEESLIEFYVINKANADILVTDDEFVGNTYINLNFIENFIDFEKIKQKKIRSY